VIQIKSVEQLKLWRQSQLGSVVIVPTMGALHSGHLALIEVAKRRFDVVLVSIFVNPGQFGPREDFFQYPRPLHADLENLQHAGVDAVFLPTDQDIYPNGYRIATRIKVPIMGKVLCGKSRPRFFEGVCSVVLRLIQLSRPMGIVLGEKDFQQLQIIKEMLTSLFYEVEVIGVKTVRDATGLALSSRNQYLSSDDRRLSAEIYHGMLLVRNASITNHRVSFLRHIFFQYITDKIPGSRIDYADIVDSRIRRLRVIKPDARLIVAVWIEKTRLIDNLALRDQFELTND